jgi:putative flavoprotein involved in K+ transport
MTTVVVGAGQAGLAVSHELAEVGVDHQVLERGAVVFTAGFRPDYARWVRFPVFDEDGFPVTGDDLATAVPGLHFCGVHFLRNRRSSLLWGVGDDARIVARTIASEQDSA